LVLRHRIYRHHTLWVWTRPSGGRRGDCGVLVLPPLGYEDTSSYRPLRHLAEKLATDGHLVLRPDWPGLGDAAGDPLDPDLVPRALSVVVAGLADLRAQGCSRLVVVGVRAGGLLALEALRRGDEAVDGLVLWGCPASGKRYLREEKAFQQLAAKAFGETPADAGALPTGAREAGGFVYGPETVAALTALSTDEISGDLLRRALVVPRDGTEAPAGLMKRLAHVDVTTREGTGLADLLEDPYKSTLSGDVADAVARFVGAADGSPVAVDVPADDGLLLDGGVRETVWRGTGGSGELVGVLCQPDGPAHPAWTVFYNAGGVRRSGPNRLWTAAARALARQGRASLRIDVRDVGDSDGVSVPHDNLDAMYSEASIEDALVAHAAVRARGARSVDVVGLCSGAFLGMQVAARVPVRRAVLFNGLAFVWDDDAKASGYTAHIVGSLLDARRWKRLLTGRIDAVALGRAVVSKGRITATDSLDRLRGRPQASPVARIIEQVVQSGTDLQLVSSEGDPSIAYLDRHLAGRPRPPLTTIPGVDHTIRPAWAHPRVLDLILGPPPPGKSP
jgi:pimeloyl-ACP methyl ester carboxylesterase